MVGTFTRAAAMSKPGTFLSQLGIITSPSNWWAMAMASVESAMRIPGDQGVLHADVAHGDAVAHGDGGELHRRAAGGADARLDGLGDLVQVHVAGDDLVVGAHHADEGALQLLLGVAQGVEQGSGWGRAPRPSSRCRCA